MTRSEFQRLTRMRLSDARVLLGNGNIEGAYYLAGLAVKCAIKACIAKRTRRYDFPPKPKFVGDLYQHDLTILLKSAGLGNALTTATTANPALKANWAVVKDWSIDSRYDVKDLNARQLYRAVAGRNGVMTWLRQRW